jgi:hypothetical protein
MSEQRLVSIQSNDGSFLAAEGGGGSALHANRPAQGPWERFTIIGLDNKNQFESGDMVAIRTDNGHFVVAENGGGRETNANRSEIGPWETFRIILLGPTPGGLFPVAGLVPHGNGVRVAFRASDGSWVTAEGGGGGAVNANRPALGPWEQFTLREDVHRDNLPQRSEEAKKALTSAGVQGLERKLTQLREDLQKQIDEIKRDQYASGQ